MKTLTKSLAVILFLGSFLFLGSVNIADKADLVSWDPAPIPTLQSIEYSPEEIMMGAHTVSEAYPKELKFKAVNPEDYDTKTVIPEGSCVSDPPTTEPDSVEASEWIIVNPKEIFVTDDLELERLPIPWIWGDDGEGGI